MLKLYALSYIELSKMTLCDLGPQALVWGNTCYPQNQFLMKSLGDMSSDEQTDGHNGDSMIPNIFSRIIKKPWKM